MHYKAPPAAAPAPPPCQQGGLEDMPGRLEDEAGARRFRGARTRHGIEWSAGRAMLPGTRVTGEAGLPPRLARMGPCAA